MQWSYEIDKYSVFVREIQINFINYKLIMSWNMYNNGWEGTRQCSLALSWKWNIEHDVKYRKLTF